MENPRIKRKVTEVRANWDEVRGEAERRFEAIESEMWDRIRRMQVEASRSQRQTTRARESFGHYRVLGLAPGASMDEVKAAWRRKMRDTHPDRFAGDPVAEARAHEEAQAINRAYRELTALLTGRENRRAD